MKEIASRELRNDTGGVIRRVQQGEPVVVTVNGRPAVQIGPLPAASRRHWIACDDLAGRLTHVAADAGMRADLARLAGETTDDLDWRM